MNNKYIHKWEIERIFGRERICICFGKYNKPNNFLNNNKLYQKNSFEKTAINAKRF